MSYYVIKDISVNRLWKEEYEKTKSTQIFRAEHTQTQSLMAVHFNPENILERMNFRTINAADETTDADASTEPEAAT
jgi:hypothetical protein